MSHWDRLPEDVRALIVAHGAARDVQRAWWRHTHYAHARHAVWEHVRAHLRALGAWPELARYSNARREWRAEPHSWLVTDACVAQAILEEARLGLWGTVAPRLA